MKALQILCRWKMFLLSITQGEWFKYMMSSCAPFPELTCRTWRTWQTMFIMKTTAAGSWLLSLTTEWTTTGLKVNCPPSKSWTNLRCLFLWRCDINQLSWSLLPVRFGVSSNRTPNSFNWIPRATFSPWICRAAIKTTTITFTQNQTKAVFYRPHVGIFFKELRRSAKRDVSVIRTCRLLRRSIPLQKQWDYTVLVRQASCLSCFHDNKFYDRRHRPLLFIISLSVCIISWTLFLSPPAPAGGCWSSYFV